MASSSKKAFMARDGTHHEAPKWMKTYNAIMQAGRVGRREEEGFGNRLIAMGGGGGEGHGHHAGVEDFRTKVWSMTGGPYCRPKHWRRNTAIAMFGIFLVCIPIAIKSAELEQRPHHPVRPIPSQLWCKNFGNNKY